MKRLAAIVIAVVALTASGPAAAAASPAANGGGRGSGRRGHTVLAIRLRRAVAARSYRPAPVGTVLLTEVAFRSVL
jgi:hypothetical protein